ncbi:putative glycine cleavage system H protein [Handroanthus impetiginosus]|uniref:Protein Abitram n=1 Tax=Handroanthus impetiginosus TaxID=429701 RepID=A0A2G9GQT9_9LAMI|nr:putative glycine cleavage system H protein [Handroanthus impetiginosus]
MKELTPNSKSEENLEISSQNCDTVQSCTSSLVTPEDVNIEQKQPKEEEEQQQEQEQEEEELTRLLLPNVEELPNTPPSAVEANFTTFYAPDFMKPGHDQYVHRHANGLCVIGLVPTHVVFKDKGGIVSVDFNVGKADRSGIKVTGKRKKNAQHFESNTALCKVCTRDSSYIVRCCVKGSLLEVNERLIKQPELLNEMAEREGYIAIIMPKPGDWLKAKASLLDFEQYRELRPGL